MPRVIRIISPAVRAVWSQEGPVLVYKAVRNIFWNTQNPQAQKETWKTKRFRDRLIIRGGHGGSCRGRKMIGVLDMSALVEGLCSSTGDTRGRKHQNQTTKQGGSYSRATIADWETIKYAGIWRQCWNIETFEFGTHYLWAWYHK